MQVGKGEWGRFEDYPQARVFSDAELADILNVNRITIRRWREEGLIPHKQRRGYSEYHVLSVIQALSKAGYAQDSPDNPTGPASMDYEK